MNVAVVRILDGRGHHTGLAGGCAVQEQVSAYLPRASGCQSRVHWTCNGRPSSLISPSEPLCIVRVSEAVKLLCCRLLCYLLFALFAVVFRQVAGTGTAAALTQPNSTAGALSRNKLHSPPS